MRIGGQHAVTATGLKFPVRKIQVLMHEIQATAEIWMRHLLERSALHNAWPLDPQQTICSFRSLCVRLRGAYLTRHKRSWRSEDVSATHRHGWCGCRLFSRSTLAIPFSRIFQRSSQHKPTETNVYVAQNFHWSDLYLYTTGCSGNANASSRYFHKSACWNLLVCKRSLENADALV